jgi:hypothetical protein
MFAFCCAGCQPAGETRVGTPHRLVAGIEVDAPLAELSSEETAALEAAVTRVVMAGADVVRPLLDEIAGTPEANRRLVLFKALYLTVDGLPRDSADRQPSYAAIEKTAARMLSSRDGGDRYMGALLTALPRRSDIVPTAVDMLTDDEEVNRGFAIAVLGQVTGRDLGFRADGAEDERAAAAERWRQWWKANRKREIYYQPPSNPVLRGLREEYYRISSMVGPYGLEVVDSRGEAVAGAVVAYSYHFASPGGVGKTKKYRASTDANGKALLAAEKAAPGLRFRGAEVIVSSLGYGKASLLVPPHLLTPNSFSISVTLEKE